MAINKVVLNNEVQLDLTADTVTADKLLKGITAHDKSGASIVGTYEGGSTPSPSPTEDNASVIFVDYEGTLLETWTKDEVAGKTALPTPPAHEGLVFEEWNWSLADIQSDTTGQVITVAPYYHTASGFVEIDIELNEGTGKTAYLFTQSMAGRGRTIDWGDGTISTTDYHHTYENYGSYTVKVSAVSGALSRVFFDNAMVRYGGKPVKAIRCNQDVTDLSYFKSMGLAVDVVLNKAFAVSGYKINICCGKLCHILDSYSAYKNGIEYISINKNYTYNIISPFNGNIGFTKIKNFYMPSRVTTISSKSFQYCFLLKSIKIDNITSIGRNAFDGCSSLQSINIPDGVTSINNYTFYNCSSLQSINIPDGVTSIGDSAFYSCSSLQSINIPDGVTSIGSYAFQNCSSLQSITIPDGVTSIGNSAFYNCQSLQSITIPSSVTSMGSTTFKNCCLLQSINIPSNVTSIGDSAFYNCQSLQSITIPDGVTSISRNAFDGCQSLQSITIPNSVTSIDSYAFQNCKSLQSITIPNSVTSIGRSAFYNCYNIRYAKINTTADINSNTYKFYNSSDYINTTYDFSEVTAIPALSSTDGLNPSDYITAIIVPDALYDNWIVTTNWATFASKIKKASEYTYQ